MLKLKYLFSNIDLATMIVKNWGYDSLDLFKYWRISANAIFPFKSEEQVYFLRFAPIDEKEESAILAELEFLTYLKESNYTAIESKVSKNGKELEIIDTPWGKYYAAVFKRVDGKALEDIELTDDIAFLWGKALGRLHTISKTYKPTYNKRNSWIDQLDWSEKVLFEFPEEREAIKELEVLKEYFLSLPITDENYGLIHYDFELDNVFYDEATNCITPIDFDDAIYHWYAMDVERALVSIENEIPAERVQEVTEGFLDGYRSEYFISNNMIELFPIFRRYANLYGYVRLLYSTKEKWNNEPEWLDNLRGRLDNLLDERKSMFGNEID